MRFINVRAVVVAACSIFIGGVSVGASADPTCSDLGVENHGQHIVGDYVTGLGAILPGPGPLSWPPNGQVGQTIGGEGAAMPGAPAAHGHFALGLPPGASFCLEQAHPDGFDIPDIGPRS
jgi:hypothetical protein